MSVPDSPLRAKPDVCDGCGEPHEIFWSVQLNGFYCFGCFTWRTSLDPIPVRNPAKVAKNPPKVATTEDELW